MFDPWRRRDGIRTFRSIFSRPPRRWWGSALGIVRLIEESGPYLSIIDNIVACDAVLFLVSALLSFAALRTPATPRGSNASEI